MFFDFCTTNGLVIEETLLSNKRSRKIMWRSPSGIYENQIEHVAKNKTWKDRAWRDRTYRTPG